MDALQPAIGWLGRAWRPFVAAVAALGGEGSRPVPAPFAAARQRGTLRFGPAKTRTAEASSAAILSGSLAAPERPAREAAPAAVVARPVVAAPALAPAAAPVEPAGATALAARLDARRAQAAGLRALLLARQRRYAEAELAFGQAVTLDAAFDLADLAGFWELERGAHEAAIRAYEGAGRPRDAVLLRATLDGRYRPRLVRTA